MITFSAHDERPIYRRVKDWLRQRVVSGTLAPGEQLPTVRDMARDMTINPNTIARAYRELEQEGYIVAVPGRGSFVAERGGVDEKRRQALLAELRTAAEELEFLGVSRAELADIIMKGKRGDEA